MPGLGVAVGLPYSAVLAGGAFVPPQPGNLLVALEPGVSNFTTDAEGITAWNGLYGTGINFTQAVDSKQPAEALKNELTIPSFDGGDDLKASSNLSFGAHTVVIAVNVASGSGGNSMVLAASTTPGSTDLFQLVFDVLPSGGSNNTFVSADFAPVGGDASSRGSGGALQDDTWRIISLVHNGTHASQEAFFNGVDQNWATRGTNNVDEGTTMVAQETFLGSRAGSLFATCLIGGVFIYDALLSDADRTTVENRLNSLLVIF